MAERHTIKLTLANRKKAHEGLDVAIAKGMAPDAKAWTMELRPRTRTDEQNDALHGLISQILKQRPFLNGLKMTKESYKATFMHALGHEAMMLPTLDGTSFFPAGLRTSRLTVSEFTDLIDWILKWCAEQELDIKHFDDGQGAAGANNPRRVAA